MKCERCEELFDDATLNIVGTWLICDDCYEDL